jgi:hypothetical protein
MPTVQRPAAQLAWNLGSIVGTQGGQAGAVSPHTNDVSKAGLLTATTPSPAQASQHWAPSLKEQSLLFWHAVMSVSRTSMTVHS